MKAIWINPTLGVTGECHVCGKPTQSNTGRKANRDFNRDLKRHLYRSAFSCISRHGRSEAFYRRKRAEGKGYHQAVIALARRRVNVLWPMLRDGETYRELPARTA